jgi:hypothetical protein
MKKSDKIVNLRPKKLGTPSDKVKTIQTFIACLFYLSQEAEREGFPYITTILKETISKIDLMSRGGSLPAPANIIDDSLYEALNFLHTLADLSPKERSDFMKVFDAIRKTCFVRERKLETHRMERITIFQ